MIKTSLVHTAESRAKLEASHHARSDDGGWIYDIIRIEYVDVGFFSVFSAFCSSYDVAYVRVSTGVFALIEAPARAVWSMEQLHEVLGGQG